MYVQARAVEVEAIHFHPWLGEVKAQLKPPQLPFYSMFTDKTKTWDRDSLCAVEIAGLYFLIRSNDIISKHLKGKC
jgi:hypothetical protein